MDRTDWVGLSRRMLGRGGPTRSDTLAIRELAGTVRWVFLRRVDPNLLARKHAELAEGTARPTPVMVAVGDSAEPGVLHGWARADS